MNARWYLPGLARFISADTLVPNPTNPQSWNRYTYTLNNPVRFSDPSGHCAAEGAGGSGQCTPIPSVPLPPLSPDDPRPVIPDVPTVDFAACETCEWFEGEQATIRESITVTGTALAETINAAHPGWNLTSSQAFLLVYGGTVTFTKTGQSCMDATGYSGCWGSSTGRNDVNIYTDASNQISGDVHWAIHELGHSFVNAIGSSGPNDKYEILQRRGYPDRGDLGVGGNCEDVLCGFASGPYDWQRSEYGDTSEEFADMYLGQPTEVWLSTYPAAREEGRLPFSVVLFYPEQGIVAKYWGGSGKENGDFVIGCPQENPVTYLQLFPPDPNKTFAETMVGTSALSEWRYLRLEESTEMDLATFYETFKYQDNTTCLETPAERWYR